MNIPFPPFEPDKSSFDPAASARVVNALPVAGGWGPMPGLTEISQALPSECVGATFVRTSTGIFRIIAGTRTRLYELDTTAYSWADITGPAGPYSVPIGDAWTFTRFGSKLVIHNLSDPIQVYDIEAGGTVANLAGSPPRAKYSWVAGDFLVLGYTDAPNGAKIVQWCELNNIEGWRVGKNGADYQELPEGDEIQGGFGENGGFTVIQRAAMQFFPFAPSSGFTFTRQVLNPKQGTLAPRSIVSIGPGAFFYLSEDGFFGGAERKPIGAERVDRWFLEQVDQTYLADVQGAADPFEKIVWWRFRKPDGTYQRLGYDWQLDQWCTTDLQVGEMVALATPAITWDGLSLLYATIDDVTEPFDSRLFSGGRPTFATFTSDNKLAYFTGAPLQATLETAQIELSPDSRTFVSGARVQTDAATFTVADGVTDYHGGTITWSTNNPPEARGKKVSFRSDGRLHKFRLIIAGGADWSIASSIKVDAQPSGDL